MHNERVRVMQGQTDDNDAVVIKNLSKVCMNTVLMNNINLVFVGVTLSSFGELVDSLCKDGTDIPIVCVHWKAFLTCECSHCKLF